MCYYQSCVFIYLQLHRNSAIFIVALANLICSRMRMNLWFEVSFLSERVINF